MKQLSLRTTDRFVAYPKHKASKLKAAILRWFVTSGRRFPWRQTSNSFYILVAEVLLCQTQATRVVTPYLEIIRRYPDAPTLARANLEELRKWFKPLGLVKRANRLIKAAQILVDKYNGHVPNDIESLMALPGLGTYSSRAVLCLGFGYPVPMIDEGSGRVLRRTLGIASSRPAYSDFLLLQSVEASFSDVSVREFNLGLIDIAAAHCHVRHPTCTSCPLFDICSHNQIKIEMKR